MKRTLPDRKAQAKRAALNALRKAKRAADRAGVKLSDWEDEFITSVSDRVKTYGRAFGDPEKGDRNAPLSVRQVKKSIRYGGQMELRTAFRFEIEAYNQLVDTADRREGVLAFNEKRPPQFKGL